MKVFVNDKELNVSDNATVTDVLVECGIDPKGIAVAVNDKVVAQSALGSTRINPCDRIIVIKAFYGG